MLIKYKLLLCFLIIIGITVPNGIIGYTKVDQSLAKIEAELVTSLQEMKKASHLDNLTIHIKYYDEVLTQSARNYAFTADEKWLDTYYASEPGLNALILEAITLGGKDDKVFFQSLSDANTRLTQLEHESIRLVMDGRQSDAIAVLESPEYWKHKQVYRNALENYAKNKGLEYDQVFDVSTIHLEASVQSIKEVLVEAETLLYVGIPIVLSMALVLAYYFFRSVVSPISRLNNVVEKISQGKYDVPFPKQGHDEIGDLGRRMQSMVHSFKAALETERQLAVAQEKLKSEKLTVIGELAARIAHDLRNPLSVLKNICQILKIQYGQKDPKMHDHLTRMENSIQRMSHQIDDVLTFVRTVPIDKQIISLRDLVAKVVSDSDIPSDVIVTMPSNDEKINCDEQKMRTVLSNVILNAVQAMDGRGLLTIKIVGYTKFVNIEISDSGPGIPEKTLPFVFEPLFTTKQTGTGLGLSSCKNIVEQHGGTINVTNNPTTFTITLPRL